MLRPPAQAPLARAAACWRRSRSARAATRTRRSRPAPTPASPAERALSGRRPADLRGAAIARAEPHQHRGRRLPAGAPPRRAPSSRPARSGSRCSCRSTTTISAAAPARPTDDQRHAGQHLHPDRARPDQPFAYRGGSGAGQRPAADARHDRRRGPTQGALLLYKIQIVSLDNRPLELKIVDPEHASRRPRPSSTSDGAVVARVAPLRGLSRGDGCCRFATGAVFDEHHAHRDARMQRRRESREPGVGVARLVSAPAQLRFSDFALRRCRRGGFALRAAQALFSSAVPVLPATVTPGIAAEAPVPSRTTPIIRRAHGARDRRRSSRACPALGGVAVQKLGCGRRPPSAIVAATVAISSGVASTWPWPIAVEPTSSSPWICGGGAAACSRRRRERPGRG